jgi:hypothetical protein
MKIFFLMLTFKIFTFHVSAYAQKKTTAISNAKPEPTAPSDWFPNWSLSPFDWKIFPQIGASQTKFQNTELSAFELGLLGNVQNIPIISDNNKTLGINLQAGYAWGKTMSKISIENASETKSGTTHRYVLKIETPFSISFIKFTPEFEYSQLIGTQIQASRMTKTSLDSAILLKKWWSAHITNTHTLNWKKKTSEPYFVSFDTWLHTKLFTNFLNFYLDNGPGVTQATTFTFLTNPESNETSHERLGNSDTLYWLALSGMDIFWKLGLNASFKYILHSNIEPDRDNILSSRLPNQSLSETNLFASYPKDTLTTSLFFGVKNLFYGLGVGYIFNYTNTSFTGSGKAKQETSNHGFGVQYEGSF